MRKKTALLVVAALMVAFTSAAQAGIDFGKDGRFVVDDVVYVNTAPAGADGGGPFLMTEVGDSTNVLETFCVEIGESIGSGSYKVGDVSGDESLETQYGESSLTGRQLVEYGAWAYYVYMTSETMHTAVNNDTNALTAVQRAIWWSMQNIDANEPYLDGGNNELDVLFGGPAITNWVAGDGSDSAWKQWTNSTGDDGDLQDLVAGLTIYYEGIGTATVTGLSWDDYQIALGVAGDSILKDEDVFIYNLVTNDANEWDVQSMIGMNTPAGDPYVPEPASLLIWSLLGAGVAGAAGRRRRG